MVNFANVIEIEKHIAKLLLNNDCVIVPEFGGFMAHHVDSLYDENDNMFYPPQRTLGFNPQLKMNDSMLVQSFVEVYDMSYPEALMRIEDDVVELKSYLESYGYYELSGLGTIVLKADGHYDFEPCEAGILTPELYGLSSFSACPVKRPAIKSQKDFSVGKVRTIAADSQADDVKVPVTEDHENKSMPYPTEICSHSVYPNISMLHKFAVACMLIVLFMLFPSSTGDNGFTAIQKGNIDTNMLFEIMPKDIMLGTPDFKKISGRLHADSAKSRSIAQTDIKVQKTEFKKDTTPKTCYTIVLASKVSLRNAEAYVMKLNKNGYSKARVYPDNNYAKVIYDEYITKEDAYHALNELNDNIEFADAWVTNVIVTE